MIICLSMKESIDNKDITSTVYVIQEIAGTKDGRPKINIMGASKYGPFNFLLPELSQLIFSPGQILIKLRHKFLLSVFDNSKINLENYKKFIISLAEQCWLNEFIWSQSKNENDLIEKLKSRLYKKKYLHKLEIAVLGCYIPLSNIKDLARLENKISKDSLFNDLIKMQVLDFKKESKLKKSIRLLGNIDNTLSKKVRKQYEESPYPRWRYFNQLISVVDFKTDFNVQIYPNKIDLDKEFDSPNVLLAGCGTGQHLMALTRYKGAKILAIDLSLSSIAYAKRKVEELNLKNIEFLQVDILE